MTFNAIPIAVVVLDDIENLCREGVPESESIEFKQDLPAGGGEQWAERSQISDKARNKILEEVVAFANSYGGRVVIGVSESEELPARANEITPIPLCHDLAERLAYAARDVVMPQIPLLTVRGVSAEGETQGCVVIDVHESPLAPHRLEAGVFQCFVRRADRSEKMTMREIQDLTVDRLRGTERVNARLKGLADSLPGVSGDRIQIQVVATPTIARISLPWNTDLDAIAPNSQTFSTHDGDINHSVPVQGFGPSRPILRGWRWDDQRQQPVYSCEVYWDGSIIMQFSVAPREDPWVLYPGWVVALLANALNEVDRVRVAAEQPEAEYAFKYQVQTNRALTVMRYGGRSPIIDSAGNLQASLYPPVYSVTTRESFRQLVDDCQRDLFNAIGVVAADIDLDI